MTLPAPRRRPTPRGWAVALLLLFATACGGAGEGVEGVHLDVPSGWSPSTPPPSDGEVAASAGWRGGRAEASTLQGVVGCGPGTVADLASAAVTGDRSPLVVTDAAVDTDVEVSGADAAIGLTLQIGAGRQDDARTVEVHGRYAQAGTALVLVELSTPVRESDPALVAATFDSLRLDAEALGTACPQP